jgi:hypothetical protein
MGKLSDGIKKIKQAKADLKQAIREKGVIVDDTTPLNEYDKAVRAIEVGTGGETSFVKNHILLGRQNGIMKFEKGKVTVDIKNCKDTAYFDGTTSAETVELTELHTSDNYFLISFWFWWDGEAETDDTQVFCTYGALGSETSKYKSISLGIMHPQTEPVLGFSLGQEGFNVLRSSGCEPTDIPKKKWVHLLFTCKFESGNTEYNSFINGEPKTALKVSIETFNISSRKIILCKKIDALTNCVNFKGNIKNFYVATTEYGFWSYTMQHLFNNLEVQSTDSVKVVSLPLQNGKDDESLFTSKSFIYDNGEKDYIIKTYENSSGFDKFGHQIRHKSASEAEVNYFDLFSVDFAKSAYFDGTNYAKLANIDNLPYGGAPRSFSLWVYPIYIDINTVCILFSYGSNADTKFNLSFNPRYIYLGDYSWSYSLKYNAWNHIAVTYDTNKEVKIYFNNKLKTIKQDFNIIDIIKGEAYIGGLYDTDFYPPVKNPLYGHLANLLVYDRALSAEEIALLYNQKAVTDGLVLHVPLQYRKDKDNMFIEKNFIYGEV